MIGILGGTFDPPHWGHLKLAQNFIETLKLDQLIWLPAGQPWQKDAGITPAETRLALTQAAADDLKASLSPALSNVSIHVNRMELDRNGPSYTIDAARELRQIYGNEVSLIWIMGADSYNNLSTWKDWELLPNYLHLAIANRSSQTQLADSSIDNVKKAFEGRITSNVADLTKSPCGKVYFDQNFHVDLSSTHIRKGLQSRGCKVDLSDAISPKVLELINSSGIYQ